MVDYKPDKEKQQCSINIYKWLSAYISHLSGKSAQVIKEQGERASLQDEKFRKTLCIEVINTILLLRLHRNDLIFHGKHLKNVNFEIRESLNFIITQAKRIFQRVNLHFCLLHKVSNVFTSNDFHHHLRHRIWPMGSLPNWKHNSPNLFKSLGVENK